MNLAIANEAEFGALTQIDDSQSGSIQWSYDDANRVLSETSGAGSVNYQYNAAAQRLTMTAADRPPVTYGLRYYRGNGAGA